MAPPKRLDSLSVAVVQLNAGNFWPDNFQKALDFSQQAIRKKAQVIVFPENFISRGTHLDLQELADHATPLVLGKFQELARQHKVHFLLGSLVEKSEKKDAFYNSSFLINSPGNISARYRKMHLFDIDLPGMAIKESDYFLKGQKPVAGKIERHLCGLTICYDLRFPELFRVYSAKLCRIIFVPANFTYRTGKDHWEILLRARAIENLCFIIAAGQSGVNPGNGVKSFGSSMIIDPWGKIVGKLGPKGEGILLRTIDLSKCDQIRRCLPALSHRAL